MLRWFYFLIRRQRSTFQPVVLVTGCSSGIGLALSRLLVTRTRYRVVLTARLASLPKLFAEFEESERVMIRPLDVSNEKERKALIQEVENKWHGVNVLINNAGISFRSVVEHMNEQDEQLQMAANYFGPMGMIREVLPHMRMLGRGKIICISSVSGMLAMPTMASYSASKHALEGACEALWYEGKPLGIDVCLVQPGFINSNSFKNVYVSQRAKEALSKNDAYSDYYRHMSPFIEKMMTRSRATPGRVARLILDVIKTENPPLWIPATLDATIFYFIRRLLPRRLLLPVLFMCLPNTKKWANEYTHKR